MKIDKVFINLLVSCKGWLIVICHGLVESKLASRGIYVRVLAD